MNITIVGLGYVGVVTAACLAQRGHRISGVDISQDKVDLINAGRSPIIEDDIDELVASAVKGGQLHATTDIAEGLAEASMAIVCVGTPSRSDGSLDTRYVEKVTQQIGDILRARTGDFWLVLRSTVAPGTVAGVVYPVLEKALGAEPAEKGVRVVFHPEFLREGTSVKDFHDPPKIVAGARTPADAGAVMGLYEGIEAPRFVTCIETAEAVKYADNCFHAVKITFANEIGQLCQAAGVDARETMDIFCADEKLNISPRYLKPGFAFGGSCLPKDLRALLAVANRGTVKIPMLGHVLESNRLQVERMLARIQESKVRDIGFYGLAFKPGTDDLRESPYVELAERLIGKGVRLRIFDTHVRLNRLVGGNRAYIDSVLPHLAELLVPEASDLEASGAIIVNHPASGAAVEAWLAQGKQVFDLTGRNLFPDSDAYHTVV